MRTLMLNRIVIMGRLGHEPEVRYTQSGKPVASFSLAVDRDFKDKASGERATDWIDVVAWDAKAKFVQQYFHNGQQAVVEGRLQIRDYTGRDGTRRRAAEVVADMGYTEVNLNLGCPSGTVTAKGKGSGMLRDPVKLDAFLAAVFANAEGPISVKTRLGVEKPEEFAAILDIYNRYPICELTIHPRVMRQLYRGQADRAAFAASLPGCRMPVCYNGDVTTAADLHTLEAQYPQLSGIMVGRGIIADPALFREARGGAPAAREELRGYLDDLYHGYSELFGSAGCAVSRMKGHWFYLIHKFEGAEKLEKQLRKAREPWEYEVVVNQIFTLPFRP